MGDISYPASYTQFVGNGVTTSLAQLWDTNPASASNVGMYARVNDLYGSIDDIVRCRWDGTHFRWVPQRESFVGALASTGGTVSILPLLTPPTLRLTGILLSNMSVSASTANAYIGQRQRVIQNSTLGAFTTTLTGLIGSNVTLLGNAVKDIEFGPTGWFIST